MRTYVFTSESVTEGHPDKVCDQISDAVLDAILAKETELAAAGYIAPNGQPADPAQVRCACETAGHHRHGVRDRRDPHAGLCGRSTASCATVLRDIGYDRAKYGFDCETCGVINAIHEPEPGHRAQGVDERRGRPSTDDAGDDPYDAVGAGDQGMVFGYACNETKHAHAHAHLPGASPGRAPGRGAQGRHHAVSLRPDGKTQVSVRYVDGQPDVRREGGRVHAARRGRGA